MVTFISFGVLNSQGDPREMEIFAGRGIKSNFETSWGKVVDVISDAFIKA